MIQTATSWGLDLVQLSLPAITTAIAVPVLTRFARRLGLADSGGGIGLHRAEARTPRALVGGIAIGIGVGVHAGTQGFIGQPWPLLLLLLVLAIGLIDDRSQAGLSAGTKLALQSLPALVFAGLVYSEGMLFCAVVFVASMAAQNLANTFDNADGALLGPAALALLPTHPAWALVLGVVLASNLRWKSSSTVILGDSGSHLVALILLSAPSAWGAFLIPALDLGRVVLVRQAQGRAWWVGDRVHLAHRLAAHGHGPGPVALLMTCAALPAIAATSFGYGPTHFAAGLGASGLLFIALLRASPAVDGRGVPLRDTQS